MKKLYILDTNDKYFSQAWEIYQYSFPTNEKRTLKEQKEIIEKNNYYFNIFVKNDSVIAILLYFKIKEDIYIEHFAINNKYRNQHLGSEILKEFISKNKNIILEIDLLEDEISVKRLEFYKRLGFKNSDFKHYQVPFRKNQKELELILLNNKKSFIKEDYELFYINLSNSIKYYL